jgi:hypothetical protein
VRAVDRVGAVDRVDGMDLVDSTDLVGAVDLVDAAANPQRSILSITSMCCSAFPDFPLYSAQMLLFIT